MKEIQLGDKVRDRVTGYEGIATSKTEFLNGCIQIEVTPRLKKGTNMKPEDILGIGIDLGQLDKVSDGLNAKKPIVKKDKGGPMRMVPRRMY